MIGASNDVLPTLGSDGWIYYWGRLLPDIQRFNPVQSIRREAGHWRIETAKGTVTADHIVNAAGTWGWEIGRMMGLEIPSVPVLHQYLVTDTIPDVAERQGECEVQPDETARLGTDVGEPREDLVPPPVPAVVRVRDELGRRRSRFT